MSGSFCFTNSEVLIDEEFQKEPFSFYNGIISNNAKASVAVDLKGFWILPGIIDMHGDGFERHLNPRPSASFEMQLGLQSAERELAVNGITTAYFAQAYSWEGGYKSTSYAKAFLKSLDEYRKHSLTDIKAQIRYEILMPEAIDELMNLINLHGIDYFAYNNHIPVAQKLWKDFPERIEGWAAKSNRSGSQLMEVVNQLAKSTPNLKNKLIPLAKQLSKLGIKSASHDDRNKDERAYYDSLGATICEFPTSLGAAQQARCGGNSIIMGAPNVVRGGSQSGSIAAVPLIEANLCDALVSDYYYPALGSSMWSLHDNKILKFAKAWGLISSGPAKALSLKRKGKLEAGFCADFVIMDPERRVIEATFCKGKPTYLAGKVAGLLLEKIKPEYTIRGKSNYER